MYEMKMPEITHLPLHFDWTERHQSNLTDKVAVLHTEAVVKAKLYKRAEAELLECLIRVEAAELFYDFKLTSIHSYCVEILNLPSGAAYDFIDVMRTAKEVPEILDAIYSGQTTVSKMRKVCSVIEPKTAKSWIAMVIDCPTRVIEKAVAMERPRAPRAESMRYVSGDQLEIQFGVSQEWADLLSKTKDRLSTKYQRNGSTEEALFLVMREAHKRDDPVERARRSVARKHRRQTASARNEKRNTSAAIDSSAYDQSEENHVDVVQLNGGQRIQNQRDQQPTRCARVGSFEETENRHFAQGDSRQNSKPNSRKRHRPIDVDHEVNFRDGGQCVQIMPSGKRCEEKRWTNLHHIEHFAEGGEHTPENLVTLCWGHHRMLHRRGERRHDS